MEIYENTTVYITSIPHAVSGGPELLHQLCSELLRRGVRACLWYYGEEPDPAPAAYRKYHVPFSRVCPDRPENILIIPETLTDAYGQFHQIRKILWWMSVDNYLRHLKFLLENYFEIVLERPFRMATYCFIPDDQMEHWVQSEYARQYLKMNDVPEAQVHFVGDYLQSGTHLGRFGGVVREERENIIAYNPKKGLDFTKQLMAAAPDLAWTPIQHMTAEEVHDLLCRAKVYIDFGNHPGQARIPREAAAAGCCIITGRRGAAANDTDIPIPASYKFADEPSAIPAILDTIRACLADYDAHSEDFAGYRAMIAGQKEKFRRDIAAALPIAYDVPKRQKVVLRVGPHAGRLLSALAAREDFDLIGAWVDTPGATTVAFGDQQTCPAIPFSDLVFLYQEGRIDSVLFEPDAQKDAERLKAAGVDEGAVGWLRW